MELQVQPLSIILRAGLRVKEILKTRKERLQLIQKLKELAQKKKDDSKDADLSNQGWQKIFADVDAKVYDARVNALIRSLLPIRLTVLQGHGVAQKLEIHGIEPRYLEIAQCLLWLALDLLDFVQLHINITNRDVAWKCSECKTYTPAIMQTLDTLSQHSAGASLDNIKPCVALIHSWLSSWPTSNVRIGSSLPQVAIVWQHWVARVNSRREAAWLFPILRQTLKRLPCPSVSHELVHDKQTSVFVYASRLPLIIKNSDDYGRALGFTISQSELFGENEAQSVAQIVSALHANINWSRTLDWESCYQSGVINGTRYKGLLTSTKEDIKAMVSGQPMLTSGTLDVNLGTVQGCIETEKALCQHVGAVHAELQPVIVQASRIFLATGFVDLSPLVAAEMSEALKNYFERLHAYHLFFALTSKGLRYKKSNLLQMPESELTRFLSLPGSEHLNVGHELVEEAGRAFQTIAISLTLVGGGVKLPAREELNFRTAGGYISCDPELHDLSSLGMSCFQGPVMQTLIATIMIGGSLPACATTQAGHHKKIEYGIVHALLI